MKARKTLSGILFGAGCAFTFIGLLSLLLPCVDNAQLKLVLASFDQSSDHPLVSLMNKGMSYALHNGWQVLFFGLILLAIGLVLLLIFTREPKRPEHRESFGTPAPYMPQWEPAAPSEPEINPFASAPLWEHQFAPAKQQEPERDNLFSAFGGPMLEPNRIEETPAPVFARDAYARPAEEKPAPVTEPAPEPVKPAPVAQPSVYSFTSEPSKPEPVYTPNEEPNEPTMLSSRIRSTVGRKREW